MMAEGKTPVSEPECAPPADLEPDDRPTRTAAARVLSLLGAFSHGGGSLTLSEISRYADLSLTTTHRLTREVMAWGGLELDDNGHYRLSSKILDLASSSTKAMRVRESALPELVDLHQRSGLTVQLAARDGRNVMYLDALRKHPNYLGENRIGGRLPLHVTATGLVLLAYAADDVVDDYLSRPLKRYTERTVTQPREFRALLDEIRERRYVVAERFLTLGAGAISAPIVGPDGEIHTAIGLTYRAGAYDPKPLVTLVRDTAGRVSRALRAVKAPPDPRWVEYNRRRAGLA